MSKRNRKNRPRQRRAAAKKISLAKPPLARGEATTGVSKSDGNSRQRVLLIFGFFLIGVAIFLNVRFVININSSDTTPIPLPTEQISSTPLLPPSHQPAHSDGQAEAPRFTALDPLQTGVNFTHPIDVDHPRAYLYFSSPASGGTAIGDINNDGRPDLFITSGPRANRLYVQTEETLVFEDVSDTAGISGGEAWGCGATMVDINADGRLDIFVANYDSPNQLFINLGDGKFQDRAAEFHLNVQDACLEGAFADYDGDSFLDLYLLTYRYENPLGMPLRPPIIRRDGQPTIQPGFEKYYGITNDSIGFASIGRGDGLFRNNGDGTFYESTQAAGIHGFGHGQSVTWWDFDNDHLIDIYVGNDFNDADQLYRNNGDGTFTDVISDTMPHTTWFSMGADVADLNQDGLLDLLSADMSSTTHFKQKSMMGSMAVHAKFLATATPRQYMRNALLVNSGTKRFKESAYLSGLDSTDWTWSVKLADFDCDGRTDVFVTNGSVRSFSDSDRLLTLNERRGKTEWDLYKDTEPLKEKNLVYRNVGDLKFQNVSQTWGLDHLGVSMAAAHGDLDGDGDLDLVVSNIDEPLTIYRNDSAENQRVTFRLHGLGGNRFGIGAKIRVSDGNVFQMKDLQPTRGFLSSNEPIVHFGCGDATEIDVDVIWPNGGLQTFKNLKCGRHYSITQIPNLPREPRAFTNPMFDTTSAPQEFAHHEHPFDDYQLQSLLPHRMSQLGPAIAAGDFDGDGDLDYFLGGAAGQPGRIAVRNESNSDSEAKFRLLVPPALSADAAAEDMGAVWLDVENDGDLDLFVASGGNEFDEDSDLYRPRLYLSDASGNLQPAPDRLPPIRLSAGPVAAADFDGDGDVDLFVGGRQVPGKYPLPASSYLLVNDRGTFLNQTAEFAPMLKEFGMVTGAIWSDSDNDHDLDLLITTEWGAIRFLRNEHTFFRDDTKAMGLDDDRGWWTGISAADLDRDGDIDYVATNLGLNSKYHASDEHPFRLYYGDFEGTGKRELVEAEYENETLFPVRGKSCSSKAMPSLAKKFTTYRSFAAASLQEIYQPECLAEAYQVSANRLQSVVLMNQDGNEFLIQPLPTEAQLSPGFGTVIADFNADGLLDIFIAQNFFSPQPETGNMDGGLGCLLAGDGNGNFSTVPSWASGIVIPDDAVAASLANLNADHHPDLLVTTNDGTLRMVLSRPNPNHPSVAVKFKNIRSTAELAGTRVSLKTIQGKSQTYEISAGGGYLSQQPPVLFFTAPRTSDAIIIAARPNCQPIEVRLADDQHSITISLDQQPIDEK